MATTPTLKVLVYGATGSQASPVVHELLRRGHRPYVFTRNSEKAATLQAAGAEIVVGDMSDRERLREASAGMDAVSLLIPFFVPPHEAPGYGRNAIDAAHAAGVKLLVWNTSGVTPPAPTGNPSVDLRIELTEYLRQRELPHIILQPTAYTENLLGPWTAPFVVNNDQLAYPNPPHVRIGWLASADMGALMVAALERPELAGRSYIVSGQENLDGPALAAAFSEALGRSIAYHAMPPKEFGAILDGIFGPGAGAGAANEYQRLWDGGQGPLMHVDMAPVLAELPVRMRSMHEWVSEHAAAFRRPSQRGGAPSV